MQTVSIPRVGAVLGLVGIASSPPRAPLLPTCNQSNRETREEEKRNRFEVASAVDIMLLVACGKIEVDLPSSICKITVGNKIIFEPYM